jgi:Right handed beta helix region
MGRLPRFPESRQTRRLFLFATMLFALLVPYSFTRGSGTMTYYVSASGSDTNPGTQASPWQTVGRVNKASLTAGDTVLFKGGDQFSGTTLMPPASGSSSAPITFGSYGSGQARFSAQTDVWVPPGGHDLVFDGFDFTGSGILFASAATGPGTYNVTIKNSAFHDTPQTALNIATHQDHNWTINNSSFHHIGDSGLISWGANVTLSHSQISDTGWNTAISWGKHGIYDKGIDSTVAYNDFSNNQAGQAISVRMHGAQIYGNTVHDTADGIAFFDYDTGAAPQGTDYVYDNRFWNISEYGFY